ANGGFEGSIDPWQIGTAAGAVAIWALDASNPAVGATSLRVTITSGSPSRAGISVRQLGVHVRPGVRYRLSIRVRAETGRQVRLSVGSTSRGTYASILGVAGTGWADVALEFLAIAGDDRAVVAIDLGRDTATTWIDEVVFTRVGP
ncbi:MAG: carbohydrate binding domain-containing protein, partial [Chloroflexi bacterium]|nr:carbohydrate binding domain-containing protein [Chloroflexota bacterium]